jgi:hypothetical protein
MLGATQLAWLKSMLTQAEPLKVIISDVAWMGPPTTTNGPDKWWSYATERQAILDYITAHAAQVQNLMLWHGDSHLIGATPGQSNSWGGFPVYCAAPLLNVGGGLYTGTFSQLYNNGGGECRQYGRVSVTDNGAEIQVSFTGWDAAAGVARVTQTDTFNTGGAPVTSTQIKSLPGGIAPPTGLGVAAVGTGGTFAAATYFWKATFQTLIGETAPSSEVTVAIALNGSANLTWTAPPAGKGIIAVKIYRGTVTNTENVRVATIPVPGISGGAPTAYTDTFPTEASATPPAAGSFAGVTLDALGRASLTDTQISALPPSYQVLACEAINEWHNTAGVGIGAALAAADLAAIGLAIQDV